MDDFKIIRIDVTDLDFLKQNKITHDQWIELSHLEAGFCNGEIDSVFVTSMATIRLLTFMSPESAQRELIKLYRKIEQSWDKKI